MLRPIKVIVNLEYECPTCKSTYWIDVKESVNPGTILCTTCNNQLQCQPIHTILLRTNKSKKEITKTIDNLNDIVQSVVDLGFPKTKVEKVVKTINIRQMNKQEIIPYVIEKLNKH